MSEINKAERKENKSHKAHFLLLGRETPPQVQQEKVINKQSSRSQGTRESGAEAEGICVSEKCHAAELTQMCVAQGNCKA